jgi:membrane protease YdiL (CAAX protease family)
VFLPFVIPVLLLVPIQTSSEELLFRGYLLQAFGLKIRNWLVLCFLSGLFFALPHAGNPEVSVNFWLVMAYYFSTGMFLAFITLKDQRLELALGVHAANNIFTSLFANYKVSVLPTPALFTIQTLDATFALAAYLLSIVVFWLVFFRKKE